LLAGRLAGRRYVEPVVVVLSPGGISVGIEIAQTLQAALRYLSSQVNGNGTSSYPPALEASEVAGHSLVLVDEWVDDAALVRSALERLRALGSPRRVVLATPAAIDRCLLEIEGELDAVFCLARLKQPSELRTFYADTTGAVGNRLKA
jgi:predicted phosphoribosyltransferase